MMVGMVGGGGGGGGGAMLGLKNVDFFFVVSGVPW